MAIWKVAQLTYKLMQDPSSLQCRIHSQRTAMSLTEVLKNYLVSYCFLFSWVHVVRLRIWNHDSTLTKRFVKNLSLGNCFFLFDCGWRIRQGFSMSRKFSIRYSTDTSYVVIKVKKVIYFSLFLHLLYYTWNTCFHTGILKIFSSMSYVHGFLDKCF